MPIRSACKVMKKIFIGIDFSKEKFDATVIKAEGVEERAPREHDVFTNNRRGYCRLVKWVKSLCRATGESDSDLWLFCGENTGGYSRGLCDYLYGSGYDVWLENALVIKRSAVMQRLKTDRSDSYVIASYAMRNYDAMKPYKPLNGNLSRLRDLFLYRHDLVKHKASLQVRREEKRLTQDASDVKRFMSQRSRRLINEINSAIAECESRMRDIIAADEELSLIYDIVTSVPGVGMQNAVCLMVCTDNFTRFGMDPRKIACYYGVAPFARESGTSVRGTPHVSYLANKMIKAMLTQAALAAIAFSETMGTYYRRLIDKGKKKKVAINNVRNKLLHIIVAMVRNRRKYEEEYNYGEEKLILC